MSMTDEEILSAAESVGLLNDCLDVETISFCILAFAKFVGEIERFKEREAIEKLFEELSDNTEPHKDYEDYDDGWVDACYACKWAVTSRGEA